MRIGLGWWALLLLALWASYSHAACTTQQLTTEFQTDPKGIGYSTPISRQNSQGVSNLFHQLRAGTDYQIPRGTVPSAEVLEQFAPAEFKALTNVTPDFKKDSLGLLISASQINMQGANTLTMFSDIFGADSATMTNLNAYKTRQGSRADVLCGGPVPLTTIDAALVPIFNP